KNFLTSSLAILTVFFLVACNSEAPAQEADTTNVASAAPAQATPAQPATRKQQPTGSQSLPPAEFQALMNQTRKPVLMDVRTAQEVAQGKISGSVNLDINSSHFNQTIQQLDKDQTYFVYCRSGRRSAAACEALEAQGIPNVVNLEGGILAWEAAGFEVEK
ncbi:MAG: rhodanese-like domain-containing protein, partial [Phaeodactylibacter sp.]|nr:rhodanese-like domain-containing protein [Phaeodactylibacter sp.]